MRRYISSQRHPALAALAMSLLLAVPVVEKPALADFYKCVGVDGSTTYNDAPCAADESIHRLNKSAREINRLDCRIAQNFAFDAVGRMRQEDTAKEVFDAYGGAQNISEGVRKLVNQVFSFATNRAISSQRIVELTVNRCEAGLLGQDMDQCSSFPEEFIAYSGGCISARQSDQTILLQPADQTAAAPSASTGSSKPNASDTNILTARPALRRPESREPSLNAASPDELPAVQSNIDELLSDIAEQE